MDTIQSHQRKRRIDHLGDAEMEILPVRARQTYWSGFALGALLTALVSLSASRVMDRYATTPDGLPEGYIQAYKVGVKDALKTNPPSWQLEETCLEVWANKK
jgi:hypothetical protein